MQTYQVRKAITVFGIQAEYFPEGILEAYQKLENKMGTTEGRTFFGVCYMNEYCASEYVAACREKYEGEGELLGCRILSIPSGTYRSKILTDWRNSPEVWIGKAFAELCKDLPRDKNLFCVEWYKDSGELVCLVKMPSV